MKENQFNLTKVNKQTHDMGSKSWWKVVDKLTGRVGSSMGLSSLFHINDINTHFQSINTDPDYVEPTQFEIKVARYSFPGPIPPKFEHKLRRHKQSFGKIANTVVLDKDEKLL